MLKNDRINMILALLIAIGLWVYVVGVENPEKDIQIKDVPITFINEETLEENGLTMLSVSDSFVDVQVTGVRSDLKNVDKSDIKITADLEGYNEGEHVVRLQIGKINNVEITTKQKITIVVDELIAAEKPVQVTITGEMNDDQEPYIVQTSPQKVMVSGAKTLVDSVVKVNAPLDVNKVANELKAFTVPLYPVDGAGETVDKVTLDMSSASVSAVNLNKKTVRLNVPVLGQDGQHLERIVTVPKTITIKGMDVDLDSVSSISAEVINVTDIYEDTSIPIVPILPDGIEVASNSQKLEVQVSVKGMETKTFEYSKDAVVIEGIEEDMTVTVEDVNIHLTAIGKTAVTDHLTAEDFLFVVNAENLEAGMHQAELQCIYEKELYHVEFYPGEVTVILTSGASEEDSDGETGDDPGVESGAEADDNLQPENGKENNAGQIDANLDVPRMQDASSATHE